MNAKRLVSALRGRGVKLYPSPAGLYICAPKGAVPGELWNELRARKSEILEVLGSFGCAVCGKYLFGESGMVCFWCRPPRDQRTILADSPGSHAEG